MDWTLAIEHNRTILIRNVTWLFTWLKLEVGGTVETLPRLTKLTVLFVLRPSESACRRLVYAAMYLRAVVAPKVKDRAASPNSTARLAKKNEHTRVAPPQFKLTDPRKNFDLFPDRPKYVTGPGPWVTDLWSDDPIYDRSALYAHQDRMNRPPAEDLDATALSRRMNALMAALGDIEAQAERLAKLQARLARRRERTGQPHLQPLRPGLPPGFRQRQKHEVDEVLAECHRLAAMARQEFPTPAPP